MTATAAATATPTYTAAATRIISRGLGPAGFFEDEAVWELVDEHPILESISFLAIDTSSGTNLASREQVLGISFHRSLSPRTLRYLPDSNTSTLCVIAR